MKMTFLGTGGAFTRADTNYHNNVLIETDEGTKILLDCGTTALESLNDLGVDPLDIDAVVITHIHADHVGGLEELAFRGMFLGGGQKFDLYTPIALLRPPNKGDTTKDYFDEVPDLWYNCLRGGLEHIQDEEGRPVKADITDYFNPHVQRFQDDSSDRVKSFSVDDVEFHMFETEHVPEKESFGVEILTEDENWVYFSADSTYRDWYAYEFHDIVFHDCMFSSYYESTVHTHFEELAENPEDVREKTHLMHYGDPEGAPEDLKKMNLVSRHESFTL